jgi:hypothetical protein
MIMAAATGKNSEMLVALSGFLVWSAKVGDKVANAIAPFRRVVEYTSGTGRS